MHEAFRENHERLNSGRKKGCRAAGVFFSLILLFSASCAPKYVSPRKSAIAPRAMVASAHPLATRAGLEILEKGGNAVDAAVAAAFALGVVEPYSSGLGGGGFMLIYPGPGAEVTVLDYRETAPSAATRDMFLDEKGNPAPGLSTRGPLAIAVPGTAAGLAAALERFGTMSLAEVTQPAIRLAEEGFPADSALIARIIATRELLKRDPCLARIFLRKGMPPLPGTIIKQPELARTLRTIAEKGPDAFYRGGLGDTLIEDLSRQGAIISKKDLESYRVRWRKPVRGFYRGYEIVSMPPPSSGGAVLIEALNILAHYDLAGLGFSSPETAHLLGEAMKLAFADRAVFMGDPAFVEVPLSTLLSPEYADKLAKKIKPGRALKSSEIIPGAGVIPVPESFKPPGTGKGEAKKESPETALAPPTLFGNEPAHTTHLSVVDEQGAAVSLTQTINTPFGSGVISCRTGIIMNNEMDDFATAAGKPNAYGLIQGENNAVAPGKIPLSSMTPTMVFKEGRLFMVVGSPGGPRIISTVLQVIVNVIDFQMSMAEAVAAPRLHHQWLPEELYLEPGRVSLPGLIKLREMGHRTGNYLLSGNAQAILVRKDGSLEGASDPRGVGKPGGL